MTRQSNIITDSEKFDFFILGKELPDRDFHITPNFRFSEFLVPGHRLPDQIHVSNIFTLCHRLQVIRDVLNVPISITSGYRTPEHNASPAVGGSKHSYHVQGMAADIKLGGMAPSDFRSWARNWSGGMGAYSTFTHLDTRPYKARWNGGY